VDDAELQSPTHEVDCFKNRVALEIEWNNKDPFYDRDLNNFRLLFDLRAISVGVIITRCDELQKTFQSLGKGSSYGNSTTHMSKLLPRTCYELSPGAAIGGMSRKPYPSDVTDDAWNFVCPYLTLMRQDAPQRDCPLREGFNALRYLARSGEAWRMIPHDFPPWPVVYQQTLRWFKAGVFEAMVHDLRAILRLLEGRDPDPTAAVIDSRTLQSSPESGSRAGYDGAKRRKGSKAHAAVDTLGRLLALRVTGAGRQDRDQVDILAEEIQEATGESVQVAYEGPGIHRRRPQGRRQAARHRPGGRETAASQAGLCAHAQTLGGGTQFRVDGPFSQAFAGLRTPGQDPWRAFTSSPSPASCSRGLLKCWLKVHNRP
jgi:transposase